jgi:hypothetical protein
MSYEGAIRSSLFTVSGRNGGVDEHKVVFNGLVLFHKYQ